jgi:rubrerythrin
MVKTSKWIRFVPVDEEGDSAAVRAYMFQANVAMDENSELVDVELLLDAPGEQEEYQEFERVRKSGQKFYLDIQT